MAIDAQRILARPADHVTQRYDSRDTILYALGVGAAQSDALDPLELQFVYEPKLQALPTMCTVVAAEPFWMAEPEWGLAGCTILHAGQTLRVHRPLPAAGVASSETCVAALWDKGPKGALIELRRRLHDQHGALVAEIGKTALIRGAGGFGGDPGPRAEVRALPGERPPDAVLELRTRSDQALLYRLSGDLNPLHADPAVATAAGFERPILHGLCTYGVAGRALLRLFCDSLPARLRALDVRFAAPLYPGETVRTEAWRVARGEVVFRCVAAERGVVVLDGGGLQYEP